MKKDRLVVYGVKIPGDFGLDFKAPLWIDQVTGINQKEISDYVSYILNLKNQDPDYIKKTWYKKNLFAEDLNFVKLLEKEIIRSYKDFVFTYQVECKKNIWINGWLNILTKGENLGIHCHSMSENSYISGAAILSECHENSTTNFYIPQLEHHDDVGTIRIKNNVGDLMMFPQWMFHSVNTVGSSVRISLGFDLFTEESIEYFSKNHTNDGIDHPISRSIKLSI